MDGREQESGRLSKGEEDITTYVTNASETR